MDSDEIQNLILKYNGGHLIDEILSEKLESASVLGEGYTSDVQRKKLTVKLNNGTKTEQSYIIKVLPSDPLMNKFMTKYNLMEKEINAYLLLEGMKTFVKKYGDKKEINWCDLIGFRSNDFLILNDLKTRDYKIINRLDCLNYEHIMLSVSTLARFHAISKVYFKSGLIEEEKVEKLRNYYLMTDDVLLEMWVTGGLIALSQVMKESWGPEWSDIADKLAKHYPNAKNRLERLISERKEEMDVFNNGDLWCCNIMFKYHDFNQNIPIHANLIDFQFAHYNSFAWDLMFLIYSSVRGTHRRLYYKEILDAYFKTFDQTLDFYKYNGPRPTRDSIEEEMQKFKYAGMLIISSTYAINTSKDVFNMEPILQSKGPYRCYPPAVFMDENYKNEVKQDFIDFVKEGILTRDYKIINRLECLNYEQIILSVSTLARFHAISKVYFKSGLIVDEKIQKLRNYYMITDDILMEMCMTGGLITLSQVMKESWGPEWSDIADKISNDYPNAKNRLKRLMSETREEMDVFNHGDLWCCNILFKYHDFNQNIPIHANLIDFQFAHYNSFAWDLMFLIYSSVRGTHRRLYYKDILDAYFKTFDETLDFYQFTGSRPTRDSIEEEMQRFKYAGMLILSSAYAINMSNEELFNMEPFLQSKGPYRCYPPAVFMDENYKNEVKQDFIDFVKEGIV